MFAHVGERPLGKPLAQRGIVGQARRRPREIGRRVGDQELPVILDAQPLAADGRRNQRHTHRERFENFEPAPAADAQRHDVD